MPLTIRFKHSELDNRYKQFCLFDFTIDLKVENENTDSFLYP